MALRDGRTAIAKFVASEFVCLLILLVTTDLLFDEGNTQSRTLVLLSVTTFSTSNLEHSLPQCHLRLEVEANNVRGASTITVASR